MKKLEFKSGTIEIYETKEEMIDILSECLGKDEVEICLKDKKFKDCFSPNIENSHYIKKIIAIKVPNENVSLISLEHWNYEYDIWTDAKINLNIDAYSSYSSFYKFQKKQDCFIEYYNTVRDDTRIEKILKTFKKGDKIYFIDNDCILSSETINYLELKFEGEFCVEVGTKERKEKFTIGRINESKYCNTYGCGKFLFPSLKMAREWALKRLQREISNLEKRILNVMSFVG